MHMYTYRHVHSGIPMPNPGIVTLFRNMSQWMGFIKIKSYKIRIGLLSNMTSILVKKMVLLK